MLRFVTYVQWRSSAGSIFVVNNQWGEWMLLIVVATSDLLGANPCKLWDLSLCSEGPIFAKKSVKWSLN